MISGIAIFSAVFLVIGAVFAIVWAFDRKRTRAVLALAPQLGLETVAKVDSMQEQGLRTVPLFAKHGFNAANVIQRNSAGLKTLVFDYACVDGDGEHVVRKDYTVVAFEGLGAELPAFSLQKRKSLLAWKSRLTRSARLAWIAIC